MGSRLTRPDQTTTMNTTRRQLLTSLGSSALIAATAGCLGSGNSSPPTPAADISPVNSLPQPTRGGEDASITVDIFSDFACPHCKDFHETVEPTLVNDYVDDGIITLRHFDFPIPVDQEQSWPAAMAARAVQDADSMNAFWTFRSNLFKNRSDLSTDLYIGLAEGTSVAEKAIRAGAEKAKYQPVVQKDKTTGQDRGVEGTPTAFVDGEKTVPSGDQSYTDVIVSAIESKR